ncbi:MAG: S9 family peptidase [Bacteroidota bacterium]
MNQSTLLLPPKAEKQAKELSIHGDTRIDNYYWLNERENPKVIDYLNNENNYTSQQLKHTEALQENLYNEIVGRIKQDDTSVPYKKNGYFYLTRYETGKEYPIYSRKKGNLEASEEIMLNVNQLAEGYDYFSIAALSVSPDNRLLAYGEDTVSRRIYTIRIKNLESGENVEDVIPNTTGRAVWANDNKTLFYTVKDEALRSYKIFKHRLGTAPEEDVEVFHEKDETFSCFVTKTRSQKFITIGSFQTVSNEYHLIDADDPDKPMRVFQPRERKLEYTIDHHDGKFFVRTNLDAQNFRLMETPEDATSKDNWKEVIPHRSDVLLEDADAFKDFLVLSERINGITQLRLRHFSGEDYYIEFGEEAYMAYISINREFDTPLLRVGYQSLTTPRSTYDFDTRNRTLDLKKQQEVIGDFDPANYVSERLYATARDGVKVPISLVRHKTVAVDGKAPLLLYGYGSYGSSMEPYFSSVRLSLLDRGFVYAIAHVRGGEEMGRHWYEDGKLLKKKNTFTDFIDCAEYLAAEQYGDKSQLYAMGGSAGGLLMGAVVNMRPDLFRGIIASVPFVDVVTTMLDESIPLTTGEFDEWGNPKVKEYYEYIKSYSPYDNVEAKDYPNILVTTGLHDSQVQYWEPAKWIAKLRDLKTDQNELLLYTNMSAGHGGASGRFRRHKQTALQFAFLLDLAEKTEVSMKN